MLINAKFDLRKPLKTLYIQKILNAPTMSFGVFIMSFGVLFTLPNYEFLGATMSLIYTTHSSIEIFFLQYQKLPLYLHR